MMPKMPLTPPEFKIPHCPICGEEAESFTFDYWGNLCGCDKCLVKKDAQEVRMEEAE